MIRRDGEGGPGRGVAGRRTGAWSTGLVVAGSIAAALALAGAVALLIDDGSRSSPGPATSAPVTAQAPPWGFTGGWGEYCYRPLPTPPGYAADFVAPGQPCLAGSRRFGPAQQIDLTARAGASIDRLSVFWGAVEPTPPVEKGGRRVHTYNWASVATAYETMLVRGITPLVLVYGSPPWAREAGWERPGTCKAAHGELCSYPPSRDHVADWGAFIAALMRRFPQMLALEVWNEPNLPRFFAPRPDPALYARLLQAAQKAAHASGVPAPIISGGVAAGASGEHGSIPAASFLDSIYRLAGEGSFEGIGTHPYPQAPPWVARMSANLDLLRRVRDRFDDRATPLWITEVGVGGRPEPRREGSVGLARQGPILVRMYRSTQNTDVRSFIVYALRDIPTEGPKFEPFGVVRANLEPKPAYCYLARHLGGSDATCGPGSGPPAGTSGD